MQWQHLVCSGSTKFEIGGQRVKVSGCDFAKDQKP